MCRAGSVVTYAEVHNPRPHEGCVEFASEIDARVALENLNGSLLYGRRIRLIDESEQGVFSKSVFQDSTNRRSTFKDSINQIKSYLYGTFQKSTYNPKRSNHSPCKSILHIPKTRITVENLSSKATWQDLKEYMSKAGKVNYCIAHKIRQNSGYVDFALEKDAKTALDILDKTYFYGRKIKLIDEFKRSRSPTPISISSDSSSESMSSSSQSSRTKSRSPSPISIRSDSNSQSRSERLESSAPQSSSSSSRYSRPISVRSHDSRSIRLISSSSQSSRSNSDSSRPLSVRSQSPSQSRSIRILSSSSQSSSHSRSQSKPISVSSRSRSPSRSKSRSQCSSYSNSNTGSDSTSESNSESDSHSTCKSRSETPIPRYRPWKIKSDSLESKSRSGRNSKGDSSKSRSRSPLSRKVIVEKIDVARNPNFTGAGSLIFGGRLGDFPNPQIDASCLLQKTILFKQKWDFDNLYKEELKNTNTTDCKIELTSQSSSNKYEDSEIDQDVKSEHSAEENVPQFRCTLCKDKFKNLTDVEKHTYSYHQIIGKSTFSSKFHH